jgi:hypothetical protein
VVRVFYRGYPHVKTTAWLAGQLFTDGVTEFDFNVDGIRFADMFHLSYEVIQVKAEERIEKCMKTKKKVK